MSKGLEALEKELKATENLYDIVKAKYESAIHDYQGTKLRNSEEKLLIERIHGQAEAYFDIMLLMKRGNFKL